MGEEFTEKEKDITEDGGVPGTAQIRKLTSYMSTMELLETAAKMATEGYDKKLFSILSRVYTEKKSFQGAYEAQMEPYVLMIQNSSVPSEYKMQTYTSFGLPQELLPKREVILNWLENCSGRRMNIAAYFIEAYQLEAELYREIMLNKALFKMFLRVVNVDTILRLYEVLIQKENKECITGAIRQLQNGKRHFNYTKRGLVLKVTEEAFASKEVFFTTKLLFCLAFDVPKEVLPCTKDLYKIIKISINYEEKITKEFVKKYKLDFDCSDLALCRYYLGNKKAVKEKTLVLRFASHLVQIPDTREKDKLLHGAFKRGGMFRMYAGCMQDGGVIEEKQRRFHYSEEEIAWVKTLPGLSKEAAE
ncbi:MAG TPA: hypothetical protein PLQ04_03620 [Lachnospiraceae bacterium]|nr:hypothetical protein [Lachnospiraceae bacterium]